MSALRLHLDVGAAGRLERQDVRSVRGFVDLLPETAALQGAGDQPAAGERAGRRPRDVTQRRHRGPEDTGSLTSLPEKQADGEDFCPHGRASALMTLKTILSWKHVFELQPFLHQDI